MEVLSKKEALSLGVKHYFTGIACQYGHIDKRNCITRQCVSCVREAQQKHRKLHPELKIKERNNAKKYYYANPKTEAEKAAKLIKIIEWSNNNRDKVNAAKKRYIENNLNAKISHSLRKRLRLATKNKQKQGSAVKNLGCSIEEFINYINSSFQDGMTWDNWGSVWHMDHKKALCFFDLSDIEQVKIACHFTNLQPLFIKDHALKTQNDISKKRNLENLDVLN